MISTIKLIIKNIVSIVQKNKLYPNNGERNGNPLQYSCLVNYMDIGAWQAIIHRATKSWTRLSNHHSLTHTAK